MRIKKYLSYKEVMKTAGESGSTFSTKSYILVMILFQTALFGAGILYHLQWWGLIAVQMFCLLCVPVLLNHFFMQKKKTIQFNEVDVYLHQMVYSFQRCPKISLALDDTVKVLNGQMRSVVNQAIYLLTCGEKETVYQDALNIIEADYACPRLKTLHRFLISIEEKGGRYHHSLEVLLSDFDRWVNRVYKYQQDVKQIKKNALIGILLSFMLASVSVFIGLILQSTSDIHINIVQEELYQVVSVFFILFNILYFLFIQIQYDCNWLSNERTEEKVMQDYRMAFQTRNKAVKYFSAGIGAAGFILAILLAYGFNIWTGAAVAMLSLYMLATPSINKRKAFIRLQEDVYMAFSEWLRDVVINLQDEPLQAAIEETYDHCPAVLKASLYKFILELENAPSDVRPFYHFLSEFQLLDISSTIKTLYAASELQSDEIELTVNTLIKRNYEMVDKHEKIKNRDSISVMRFGEYIPMVFVSVKMSVDMLLIITNYL